MTATPKKLCKNCDERKPAEQVYLVSRHGGGNYRRAGRMIRTSICTDCILDIAPIAHNGRGHGTHSRWDLASIYHRSRELGYQAPRIGNIDRREVEKWLKESASA